MPCTRNAGTEEELKYVSKKGWVPTEALKWFSGNRSEQVQYNCG